MTHIVSPDSQIDDSMFNNHENWESGGEGCTTPTMKLSLLETPVAKSAGATKQRSARFKTRELAGYLSLEEQDYLITAADSSRPKSSPDKGAIAFKASNDSNRARRTTSKGVTKTTCFPRNVSLAATWNIDLLHEIGEHLAEDTAARSAQDLLAPNVGLNRDPFAGKSFEPLSEDPFLTGKLAAAYINGLQGSGIGATIKHFACSEQETERLKNDPVLEGKVIRYKAEDMSDEEAEREDDLLETRKLIQKAGVEGMVLLKNEGGLLPIEPSSMTKIAVIGPNANRTFAGGGGCAGTAVPLNSVRKIPGREVKYAQGCLIHEQLPLAADHCSQTHKNRTNGFEEKDKTDSLQEATNIAAWADVAVVIMNFNKGRDLEGYDRKTTDLSNNDSQYLLVEAVLKTNPKTIVVNKSSTPVVMPWADRVPAIIQTWYQDQEADDILADVLFGISNPSGKLPITFPRKASDNPAHEKRQPGANPKAEYTENLSTGYRWHESQNITPLFPFGHGLSYTTFTYGKPSISRTILSEDDRITISIPITNSGSIAGAETVQAYIHASTSKLVRAEKELQAFDKVFLQPGEKKVAVLKLDRSSVGYFDDDAKIWMAEQGRYQVLIGSSSVDLRRQCGFEIKRTFTWLS